jgi:hypothetical protein
MGENQETRTRIVSRKERLQRLKKRLEKRQSRPQGEFKDPTYVHITLEDINKLNTVITEFPVWKFTSDISLDEFDLVKKQLHELTRTKSFPDIEQVDDYVRELKKSIGDKLYVCRLHLFKANAKETVYYITSMFTDATQG